ncbi:phage holin [Streptococcus lutetiensis]|jgi:phi LC3 family holin|uniref:phage holin n=1 Tax=Streptococcus lutetiensis TaxID=150055 RepID=UPI001BDA5BCC|nr:phage holin [Streptococcus lutetiensis]MBD8955624.1 phage holin [Streptococcus lutetiensis]MBD8955873.1 phage holin [Streptococcus lutetiensis]MBT0929298.1 phage holin [Streptococcus lutetiensis]MBT0950283.1 phage holin [Streptococcus lutetiensis]
MINWKLRFKNKATLIAIASTVILLAQQLGLKLPDNIEDVVNTVLTLLVLLGVVNDPTTEGISDSPKALTYTEPKKGLGESNEKE